MQQNTVNSSVLWLGSRARAGARARRPENQREKPKKKKRLSTMPELSRPGCSASKSRRTDFQFFRIGSPTQCQYTMGGSNRTGRTSSSKQAMRSWATTLTSALCLPPREWEGLQSCSLQLRATIPTSTPVGVRGRRRSLEGALHVLMFSRLAFGPVSFCQGVALNENRTLFLENMGSPTLGLNGLWATLCPGRTLAKTISVDP